MNRIRQSVPIQHPLAPVLAIATRLLGFAVIVVALMILQMLIVNADTRLRTCEGTLVKNGGWLTDGIPPDFDGICQLSRTDRAAVLHVCGYGPCEVSGTVTDCPVECVKFIYVTSIRRIDAKGPSK
jgi:hypothetical protein